MEAIGAFILIERSNNLPSSSSSLRCIFNLIKDNKFKNSAKLKEITTSSKVQESSFMWMKVIMECAFYY